MASATRKRIAPDARRELIEGAAARLFADRGYGGTTLDDIAADAHVTKPMVYRHFESKKALYLALLERHRDDMPRFLEQADMGAVLERWFAYVQERPHGWKMLFRDASGDAEIQAYRLEVQATARALIAVMVEAQAESALPPEEVEPLAELLRTGLAGLALWWIDHPQVERSVLVEVAGRVLAGLRE
jgi:AcrR family transcriptional regulator